MELENERLLNTIHKLCFSLIKRLEVVEKKSSDEVFVNAIITINQQCDVLLKEAEMLAKATEVKLPEDNILPFTKAWDDISKSKKDGASVRLMAALVYISLVNYLPELMFDLNDQKKANPEIQEIGNKFKSILEQSSENLKQFFSEKQVKKTQEKTDEEKPALQ